MNKLPHVAVLGATGAVGQEFIRLFEERNFSFASLKLLASAKSAGKKLMVCGEEYTVEEAKPDSFKDIDIALFAGGKVSEVLAPEAVRRGAVVIDNSSAFRMDPQVPLIIPEINPEDIESISVLTGAAAAALYGSNAANGAIVITTKKGQVGKLQVGVSSGIEWLNAFKMPEFQGR